MKRKITFLLSALIALMLITQSFSVMGQTSPVTFTMSEQGWTSGNAIGNGTFKLSNGNNSIFTYTSGAGSNTNAPKFYTTNEVRVYGKSSANASEGNWIQIGIPANTTVTAIEITASQTKTFNYYIDGSATSWSASN